jgi:hypothetical protein
MIFRHLSNNDGSVGKSKNLEIKTSLFEDKLTKILN